MGRPQFTLNHAACEERFFWRKFDVSQTPVTPSLGRNVTGFGGDLNLLYLQHARRVQFAPETFDPLPSGFRPMPNGVPQIIGKKLNGILEYGFVTTEHGKFAY